MEVSRDCIYPQKISSGIQPWIIKLISHLIQCVELNWPKTYRLLLCCLDGMWGNPDPWNWKIAKLWDVVNHREKGSHPSEFGQTAQAALPGLVHLMFPGEVSVYIHTHISHCLHTHNHWPIMLDTNLVYLQNSITYIVYDLAAFNLDSRRRRHNRRRPWASDELYLTDNICVV